MFIANAIAQVYSVSDPTYPRRVSQAASQNDLKTKFFFRCSEDVGVLDRTLLRTFTDCGPIAVIYVFKQLALQRNDQ